MVAVGMITMFRREMWLSPMRFSPMRFPPVRFPPVRFLPVRFLSVVLLPRRSHTFLISLTSLISLRFHLAAELGVNFADYLVCSHPCLVVDSPDDTLEAIAGV
jgi:hypothetical protein